MHRLLLLLILPLAGCVTSYQHLSDPRIAGDGYDLVCGGIEHDVRGLRLRGDICTNASDGGGEFLHAAVEYRWGRQP